MEKNRDHSTPQNGAEYGSQSQDCWKYVMRCATFVLSIGGGSAGGGAKGGKKKAQRSVSKSPQPASKPKDDVDDLDLNFATGEGDEETL